MVRLVDPRDGMSIYDPCSGSGGMLIYARNHVADNGGNTANLFLAGQEANGTTWSISKMNMLLHGIRDADLRNNDTLTDPEHIRDGELMRFDRVITNPPFSQNYDRSQLKHLERFRYGYTPEGGKKADLMFLQHMLAVLKTDGIVATVMPHGVLFRGGEEGKIRQRLIEDDLLDTVIGVGPNLFYGTGIPAAILILRAKGSKPAERCGKVLFINADREYAEGRAQNTLGPQHEQKIIATYRDFADIDGFARSVTTADLAENGFNCNIRRYADNAPPPEPHDVLAHLHGGVPLAELNDAAPLLAQAGIDVATFFSDRGDGYATWNCDIQTPASREAARDTIGQAVAQRNTGARLHKWWHEAARPGLLGLPETGTLVGLRSDLVVALVALLEPERIDRFVAAGIAATWWEDSVFDLQAAASRGWKSVLEGWLTTAEATQDDRNAPDLADQTAIRLLASDARDQRRELATEVARLDAQIRATQPSGDDEEDGEPEETISPRELTQLKAARSNAKRDLKAIDAGLLAAARSALTSIDAERALDLVLRELRSRLERLLGEHYALIERQVIAWHDNLADKYGTTLRQLEAARKEASVRLDKHLRELGYA